MDSKEGFDGKRGDDGLHHGVPFLSPDAAGAAGLGLCAGALALLVLPGKRRVLAISPEDPGQRNCRALRISRSAFMRSREELRSAGYLLYEHDPGTRTVKYYLVSNVRPHMLVTPAEMLAGTKSYQDFLSGTPAQKEVNHVAYESCPEAVSGN